MLSDSLLHLFFRRRWRGFEPLHRLFGRRLITTRNCHGVRLALDPHDYVDSVVLREGFYESEVFDALREAFSPTAVFWDVGSCFGLHAVTAAALCPGMQVHAFEPNPASAARVRVNAALNDVKVTVWPVALDEHDGQADLHLPGPGNSGMATLRPFNGVVFRRAATVETQRAETFVRTHAVPAPTVMKLDVEGSELAVLRGWGGLQRTPQLRTIVLECHPSVAAANSVDPIAVLLREAGFTLRPLPRQEDTAHTLINVIATRPKANALP